MSDHNGEWIWKSEHVELFQGVESKSCNFSDSPADGCHKYSEMKFLNEREDHMQYKQSTNDLRKYWDQRISRKLQSWKDNIQKL